MRCQLFKSSVYTDEDNDQNNMTVKKLSLRPTAGMPWGPIHERSQTAVARATDICDLS